MATTDELIERLAADAEPLRSGAASRRLAGGVALGAAVAMSAIFAWLGEPLQAVPSIGAAAFAMKLLFCIAILAASFALLLIAGRPGHDLGWRWLWLLVPPALVAASAAMELAIAAPGLWDELWLGSTWPTCLLAITLLSVPVFAGILWAFQRLAPTRLRLTGLLTGLAAGSASATLYALYCPETSATFLAGWYSLGILLAGLFGLVIGPKLLRW